MKWSIALYDLVAPYMLRGAPLGPFHALISVLDVSEYDSAVSEDAVVIRGLSRVRGEVGGFIDPQTFSAGLNGQNVEGHPRDDDGRRDPWIDIRDSNIVFEMTALREASATIANAADDLNSGDHAELLSLIDALDDDPASAPSDYPSTAFTLDMVVTAAVLRLPFLKGARMLADGRLVPVEGDDRVTITLPRFKLRLSQGSATGDPLDLAMMSFGVDGLDDEADLGVVDLIRMEPPYAFLGDSRTVGIGFRSATLDLSTGVTPIEVLEQFGFDASWTGLYLPELRLFVAPNGLEDFAVSAGARNLLIGWGAQPGVTGDFALAVIDQGEADLILDARFVDPSGRTYGTRLQGDAAVAQVPPVTTLIVDVRGGRPPYSVTIGGAPGRTAEVDLGSDTRRTVAVAVSDASGTPLSATLEIVVTPYRPEITIIPGSAGRVEIVAQETIRAGQVLPLPKLFLASQSATHATVRLLGAVGETVWNPATVAPAVDDELSTTFELGDGEEVEVTVSILPPAEADEDIHAYWRFELPTPFSNTFLDYVGDPDNSGTRPAVSQGPNAGFGLGSTEVMETYRSLLVDVPPATAVTIEGFASYENKDGQQSRQFNYNLARHRALGVQELIEVEFPGRFAITVLPAPFVGDLEDDDPWVLQWETQAADRNTWWRATATVPVAPQPEITVTATVRRTEGVEDEVVETVDPPPPDPSPPEWFRSIALKVRIVQNTFVALELSGEIDFETAAEEQLRRGAIAANASPGEEDAAATLTTQALGQNPSDGVVAYRLLVQVDDAAQTWTVSVALGADPADVDGLLLAGAQPNATIGSGQPGLNMLGMTTAMAPVLADTAPENPLNGDVGALALSATAIVIPFTMSALGWLTVQRVILFGGEILVRDRPTGPEVNLLFDVETDISARIAIGAAQDDEDPGADTGEGGFEILTISETQPLKIRYRSVGVRLGYSPDAGDRFQFRPVFDSSKGYTIDVGGPGGIRVAEPLGRILQVLGARLARQNPMTFEIDLGFSADLGVVSVDRARVRLPLDPPGRPELTALAASIDIPAVLRASGYLEIGSTLDEDGVEICEIRGGLDLTIVPIKLRIRAEMAIAQIPEEGGGPATGVVVAIEVTFPAPIPLGSSGLGLLGVLGLFAMHYGRNEADFADEATPALAWLQATGGNPTKLSEGGQDFWTPQIDRWAFGVGAVLGTMEGGTIFNLKGVFLLELPGPRILMMMKAALLTPPPALEGVEEAGGSLLAVIDIDAGRGTLTIGIVAQYAIRPLVEVKIPIEAFFNLGNRHEWHIFLGTVDEPIQAKVILVFEGSGYFMISGHGIDHPRFDTPINDQLAIAAGMHVELIWGSKEVKIYASVAGGFDALMGFDPFFLQGFLTVRGELRLIIIGISAYAELDVTVGTDPETDQEIGHLQGQICGEVDLFFFKIKGCVDFSLGEEPGPPLPPLVTRLSLVSRSPALAQGTGTDTPIDAVLAEGIMREDAPDADAFVEPHLADDDDTRPRRVPVDAVLALSLSASPGQSTVDVLGEDFEAAAPGSTADGLTKRSDQEVFYQLVSVELVGGGLSEGDRPAVWWAGDPATDKPPLVQLALLTWVPTSIESAIERSEFLLQTVTDRWGTVCHDPAPAAPVLWAFHREPIGPSEIGWTIRGTAWPDPEDTVRSESTDLDIEVVEAWRSGLDLDIWRGILPGVIVGNAIECAFGAEPPAPDDGGIVLPDLEISAEALAPARRAFAEQMEAFEAARRTAPADIFTGLTAPRTPVRRRTTTVTLAAARPATAVLARPTAAAAAEPAAAIATRSLAAEMARFTDGRRTARRPTERLSVGEAFRRLELGTAFDTAAFLTLDGSAAAAPPVPEPTLCDARILAAPHLDNGETISPLGDASRTAEIEAAWDEAGFAPSPLSHAIRLRPGGFVEGRLLLAVMRFLVDLEFTVVRMLAADGSEITRVVPTSDDFVPPRDLPDRWTDPDGPWSVDVDHAIRFDDDFTDPVEGAWRTVLVDLPNAEAAEWVEIGLELPDGPVNSTELLARLSPRTDGRAAAEEETGPAPGKAVLNRLFYVLCFEFIRIGEALREAYDQQLVESDRGAAGRYLSIDAGNVAMLQPDTRYGVRATWLQGLGGEESEEGETPATRSETFWFHTTAEPPRRLGGYMLLTLPNERETHVFGQEPLKLIFSTPQVVNLFAAHGLTLQVSLRAASFRHPDPDDLAEDEDYPFGLGPLETEGLGPLVLSAYEETLQEVLEGQCIAIDGMRVRHLLRIIDVPLDPLTDYVLDIVTVPEADPEGGERSIVHSVSFSTGAYPTLVQFARSPAGAERPSPLGRVGGDAGHRHAVRGTRSRGRGARRRDARGGAGADAGAGPPPDDDLLGAGRERRAAAGGDPDRFARADAAVLGDPREGRRRQRGARQRILASKAARLAGPSPRCRDRGPD